MSCSSPAGACSTGSSPPARRRCGAACSTTATDRIDVPIKPGAGVDALYAPRRTVLDPILVDAARDAGAEVRFGVTVTGLRRDRNGRVTGVVGRDESGAPFEAERPDHRGRRRDGLDGRPLRRRTGGTGRRASAAAFIYGYWDGLPVHDYELFYRPGVTAGLFPTNDGQVCVFAGTSPRRFRSEARRGRGARLRPPPGRGRPRRARPGAGARAPEAAAGVRGAAPGYLRRAYGPGWALVGDAGYFKDPITSHGITDALRDAELLARAIITAATRARPTRRSPSPPTRPPGTASRSGCSPPPTRSPRSPGISTRSRCCCGS